MRILILLLVHIASLVIGKKRSKNRAYQTSLKVCGSPRHLDLYTTAHVTRSTLVKALARKYWGFSELLLPL